MKVLIIGGGGREHALAWKAAQDEGTRVFVAPGNAGTAREPAVENVPLAAEDIDGLVRFAHDERIDLTIVGPEAPLVAGICDRMQERGLRCFGPTASAARLEGSKVFAKEFLERHDIPTAAHAVFHDEDAAVRHVRERPAPLVVKADGLAAGKGVTVAATADEAIAAIRAAMRERVFGDAGTRVVVEDCLDGEEASFICLVDGEDVLPLVSSQDHKARDDGDRGPNTGGMGAYSPAPVVTEAVSARILDEVIRPTVRGLAGDGVPYRGFLYAGLMLADDGTPNVLEFNCRCGDPETQPLMMRLRSSLAELCTRAVEGTLGRAEAGWDPRAALAVVLAAGGYPGEYRKGDEIAGLDAIGGDDVKVFHAGTARRNGAVVTSGGRVLAVTALGATVRDAQRRSYDAVKRIRFRDMYYRTDIGYRAVAREEQAK